MEAAGGLVLLAAAAIALLWANSPWSDSYFDLLHHHIVVDVGILRVDEELHFWINDVAMVVFFFLVGLEIKRELVLGELSSPSRVAVPLAAAVGGMLVPVAIFLLVVQGAEAREGWGVPMATDIAFALGLVALLGRVPQGLQVLLLAIAIFDDIGAVAVIAIFYTESVQLEPLGVAVAAFVAMFVLNQLGVRPVLVYVAIGVVAWASVLESGVHTTIVGVLAGLLTPTRAWVGPVGYPERVQQRLDEFRAGLTEDDEDPSAREHRVHALVEISDMSRETMAPLDRLEHELHPWSAFVVIPAFALANAGVELSGDTLAAAFESSLMWGVLLGLVLGKPAGIMLGAWLAVRLGARLPLDVSWFGVLGVGVLAGIGFTVALFISDLAFDESLLTEVKVGILAASLIAGVVGMLLLYARSGRVERDPA